MTKEPYLPLFFGDFLASTAFWRGDEQALYLLLLGYQWTSGPLPALPAELATAVRYEQKEFARLWKKVGAKFERTEAGLVNRRLEAHRAKAKLIASKNSDAGKKGAVARWRSDSERHTGVNGESIASAMADATKTPIAEGMAVGNSSNPIQSKLKSKTLAKEGEPECH